jgi:hypothetical protein
VAADLAPNPPGKIADTQTLGPCLAVDATSIYWVDQSMGNRVLKAPLQGGGTPQAIATGVGPRSCVVIDATFAYFATPSTDADAGVGDTIWRAALAGGNQSPIAVGQHVKGKLVVAGGFLYWATDVYGPPDGMYSGMDAIVRMPVGGGAVETLFADVQPEPAGLAVDATSIYWSDNSGVFSRPIANPQAAPRSFGMSTIHGNTFAVDAEHLALVEVQAIGMGDVALFALDGSGRKVLSTALAASPLAVDGSGVYAEQDDHLVRLALDGSTSTILAQAAPRALALDSTNVYFTDGAAILKLPK